MSVPSNKENGVSLRLLNWTMAALAVLLSVLLLLATYRATNGFVSMRNAADNYIAWQQAASEMQAGSDYLTDQARCFAVTGDMEYLENFFYEAEVTRRRDNALESINEYLSDTSASEALAAAMGNSVDLMQREYYSMRLVAEAYDYDIDALPEAIRRTALTPSDAALSPEEKAELARDILFDDIYQQYKNDINQNMLLCVRALVVTTQAQQSDASARLLSVLRQQMILIAGLLVIVLLIVLLSASLIMRPLERSVFYIRAQQPLPLEGAKEYRFVAHAYNDIYEENKRSHERLTYDATHDILTGLYNRSAYEDICASAEEASMALILVDVDNFKGFNDTYGHAVGDRVLKTVAKTLLNNFRTEDCVCRIGGDEFAIIMSHADSSLRRLVENKITRINAILANPDEDMPPVTLSVGVAFGDRKNSTGNIFKDADAALYRVKEAGRNGCAFYE